MPSQSRQPMNPLLRKTYSEKYLAMQLLLKQVRSAGPAWSIGTKILRGDELDEFKSSICHKIMEMRVNKDLEFSVPRNHDDLAWKNLASFHATKKRVDLNSGKERLSLIQSLRTWAVEPASDPGSEHRRRISIRALRRKFPDMIRTIRPPELAVTRKEQDFIVKAMERKVWILKDDVIFRERSSSVTFPKDTEVKFSLRNSFHVEDDVGNIRDIHPSFVRKARKRDIERINRMEAEPEQDKSLSQYDSGPGF